MDKIVEWPAFRYGPKGEAEVFNAEKDVPEGWADHPSKVVENFDPNGGAAKDPTAAYNAAIGAPNAKVDADIGAGSGVGEQGLDSQQGGETVDADGWPWDAGRNTEDKGVTASGQWKLKPGQSRLPAVPGYPKQKLDL